MIKSFLPSATVFTSNGERIIQAIKCIEHRELGDWYIDLVTPLEYQSYLEKDYILVVPTKEKGNQPFRINNPKITDKVDVRAYHVGFDTRNYAVELSTILNGNAQACLDELDTEIDGTHPFTFTSTITTLKSFSVVDSSLYNALIQIADEYNGILDFDGWNVTITSSIGSDNGVILAYGKNIQESEINENWDLVVTKLKPIGNNGITLTPAWLTTDVSYDRPYTKIMDFDSDDVTDLEFVAQLYLDRYKVPRVNYKVKADVEQNVALGDSVTVNARQFTTTAEVLSFDYNPLINRVIQVEFGNFRPTLKQFFSDQAVVTEDKAVKRAYVRIDEEIGEVETWAQNQITLAVGEKEDIFYKQDTEPFSNIALNGDFANTSNWVLSNATISDGELNCNTALALYVYQTVSIVSGRKYYVKFKAKSSVSSNINLSLQSSGAVNVSNVLTTGIIPSDYTEYSAILTATANGARVTFTRAAVGGTVYVDEVMLIDLTDDYGAGNEPSKTDMDSFIKRIWLDTTNGTYKSFRGGGWNPASELKGSKFVLDDDGGKFYGDGFKIYNSAAVLKAFFDNVLDQLNLGVSVGMEKVIPANLTELTQYAKGKYGIIFGDDRDVDGFPYSYLTFYDVSTVAGLPGPLFAMNAKTQKQMTLDCEYLDIPKGQIRFPGTQVASTDVNTLDDYEEGTWTPTVVGITTAGAGTYTTQLGKYTKVGNKVSFAIQIVLTAHTGTGGMRINNLPFTCADDGMNVPCTITSLNLTYSGQLAAWINPNTTQLDLRSMSTGGAGGVVAMDGTCTLYIQGTYMV